MQTLLSTLLSNSRMKQSKPRRLLQLRAMNFASQSISSIGVKTLRNKTSLICQFLSLANKYNSKHTDTRPKTIERELFSMCMATVHIAMWMECLRSAWQRTTTRSLEWIKEDLANLKDRGALLKTKRISTTTSGSLSLRQSRNTRSISKKHQCSFLVVPLAD